MKFVPKSVTKAVGMSVLRAKKKSPTIFFVGGIAGVVGSTVLACRATLKVEDKLEEVDARIKDVILPEPERSKLPTSKRNDYYKDVVWVYATSAYDVAKLYGPAVILGGLSIAALAGSHRTLMKRNAALTATVTTLTTAFEAYRSRVADAVGAYREDEIYRGVESLVAIDEDGNKFVEKKYADGTHKGIYSKLFDEFSPFWSKEPEYNQAFVLLQLNMLNQQLALKGHVFLNEAYDKLGIERTPEGQIVGWVYDKGSGYIDFGLDSPESDTFMSGKERSVWLDFNVDGPILDLI